MEQAQANSQLSSKRRLLAPRRQVREMWGMFPPGTPAFAAGRGSAYGLRVPPQVSPMQTARGPECRMGGPVPATSESACLTGQTRRPASCRPARQAPAAQQAHRWVWPCSHSWEPSNCKHAPMALPPWYCTALPSACCEVKDFLKNLCGQAHGAAQGAFGIPSSRAPEPPSSPHGHSTYNASSPSHNGYQQQQQGGMMGTPPIDHPWSYAPHRPLSQGPGLPLGSNGWHQYVAPFSPVYGQQARSDSLCVGGIETEGASGPSEERGWYPKLSSTGDCHKSEHVAWSLPHRRK